MVAMSCAFATNTLALGVSTREIFEGVQKLQDDDVNMNGNWFRMTAIPFENRRHD